MPITALFAALLAPLFIVLSFRVIFVRRAEKIAVGDAGNKMLARRMRVHGNFAEYAPFALVLMGIAEGLGAHRLVLYSAGGCLLAGRYLHAFGMSRQPDILPLRASGMMLTIIAIAIAAVACLLRALSSAHLF